MGSFRQTKDIDGYTYHYDYENRLTQINKNDDADEVAAYTYDAPGRWIRKVDSAAGETTLYYHNYNWQVITYE